MDSVAHSSSAHAGFERDLQFIPDADLRAEIEATQWLAVDVAEAGDLESRDYAEFVLAALVVEAERRERLRRLRPHDPLLPGRPRRNPDLRRRVETVKAAWPIARLCQEMLGLDLERIGADRWKARCPLGVHDDSAPSFVVYPDGHAHCFGCGWTGDAIGLVQRIAGLRFYDALDLLEREGGQR